MIRSPIRGTFCKASFFLWLRNSYLSLSLSIHPNYPSRHYSSSSYIEMVQGVEIIVDEKASNARYILDKNPADGTIIQQVKCSTENEVDTKIKKLKEQQKKWRCVSLEERVNLIRNALSNFEENTNPNELQQLISKEMGKTLPESKDEVDELISWKDEMLDLVYEANKPQKVDNAMIIRDPLGLVAVISPWNFPAGEIMLHAIPALVAGNGVIVKPSEMTPLTGRFVVDKLKEKSDIMPIDIAQGDGEVGEMIVKHPDMNSISMTGSCATGKRIMQTCGKDLKRLILELGGKDPMIVFEDADLELAAKDAVECSTANAGQVCCSVEKVFVEKSVKENFENLCIERCKSIKAGPFDKGESTIGPMVSKMQRERVKDQVDDAVEKGAKMLYKGDIIASEEQIAAGNFYPATVLTDLKPNMQISMTETFGPIVALYEFDGSEEEAIELANDTQYGLCASVYSKNLQKCTRVASRISAGQVGVNAWSIAAAPISCPFIGHKQSGFGTHSGQDGYRQFSVPKSIIFREDDVDGADHDDNLTVGAMLKTATTPEQ